MVQTASNVRIDKPNTAGAVWVAPKGSPLPTDPTSALDPSFLCAGYLLKGGVTSINSRGANNIVAYGGDIVAVATFDDLTTYDFTLIETNDVSLGLYRGTSNVATVGGVRTIKYNSLDLNHYAVVIQTTSTTGLAKRIVGADAQVTTRGNIVMSDEAATVMPVTLTFFPDVSGNKAYEYQALTAAAIPSIASVGDHDGTPTSLPIAGGTLGTVNGSGFLGATAVSVAGTTVASANWEVINDNRIEFLIPAHAAASGLPVVVTNATGASTNGATLVTYA